MYIAPDINNDSFDQKKTGNTQGRLYLIVTIVTGLRPRKAEPLAVISSQAPLKIKVYTVKYENACKMDARGSARNRWPLARNISNIGSVNSVESL